MRTIEQEINNIPSKIDLLSKMIEEISQKMDGLAGEMKLAELEVENTEMEIEQLSAIPDHDRSQTQRNRLGLLLRKQRRLEKKMDGLYADKASLGKQMDGLQKDKDELREEKASLRRRLDSLIVDKVADRRANASALTPVPVPNRVSRVCLIQHHQSSASNFAVSKLERYPPQQIGLKFSCTWESSSTIHRFRELFPIDAESVASPERLVLADKCLRERFLDAFNLHIIHETGESDDNRERVQLDHLFPIAERFGFHAFRSKSGEHSLHDLGCPDGIASSRSVPDGYGKKRYRRGHDTFQMVAMIIEGKHNIDAPLEGFPQAAASACNAGLSIIRKGVPASQVRIPIWSSNGQLMKFGLVRFLEPAFPVVEVTSPTLDISDSHQRAIAASAVCHLESWLKAPPVECFLDEQPNLKLSYSEDQYYFKPLENMFLIENQLDRSLRTFFYNTEPLKQSAECLQFCELPITIQTTGHSGRLVFQNLATQGYRIGLPSSSQQRLQFLAKLKQAVDLIHLTGVVHLDLYPSNIMWKIDESSIMHIKIIDWDACHRLGSDLSVATRDQLQIRYSQSHHPDLSALAGVTHASKELDLVLLRILEAHLQAEELQSSVKEDLDASFFKLTL